MRHGTFRELLRVSGAHGRHALATRSAVQLDAPRAIGPRHLLYPLADQRADVVHPPRRDSRAELDRLWEAAGPDAIPPCGLAHGDGAAGPEKAGKTDETSVRKRVCVMHETNHPVVDVIVSRRAVQSSKTTSGNDIDWSEISWTDFSSFPK